MAGYRWHGYKWNEHISSSLVSFVLDLFFLFFLYLIISRAGVDGMEQEINDWASELNFIQVSLDIHPQKF